MTTSHFFLQYSAPIFLFFAAFLAGALNSVAGGGSFISFPALLFTHMAPIAANATNTAALWPGSFAGAVGFRRDLASVRRWMLLLMIPALAGGATGAILLLHTSTKTFTQLVPWLILGATLLVASQEIVSRRLNLLSRGHEDPTAGWVVFVFVFQFLVSVYGGYFGAGMGILMIAALGLIGMADLHQMNGLKNLLAFGINGIAAIYFAASGAVDWNDAILMAIAAIAGALTGAKLAYLFGRGFVRGAVVVIGVAMTIALFLKR